MKKSKWTKAALAFSACLFLLWWALGTGATLAWFSDQDAVRNEFQIGLLDLDVSYRNIYMDGYEPLQGTTEAFYDEALYEPGYTQTVYLKIENKGTVPFDYKTAVTVSDYTLATNVYGQSFQLFDYLKFGLTTAKTEAELDALVATRNLAREVANMPLNHYYEDDFTTVQSELGAGETIYMALVVRMPEEVDNAANYRGSDIPRVELGVIVTATQKAD